MALIEKISKDPNLPPQRFKLYAVRQKGKTTFFATRKTADKALTTKGARLFFCHWNPFAQEYEVAEINRKVEENPR